MAPQWLIREVGAPSLIQPLQPVDLMCERKTVLNLISPIFGGKIKMVCKEPCMMHMKSGMVDGMLLGMLIGAIYGAVKVYRSEETPDAQKAAVDIADWSVHVAVVCALVGALLALARGI